MRWTMAGAGGGRVAPVGHSGGSGRVLGAKDTCSLAPTRSGPALSQIFPMRRAPAKPYGVRERHGNAA